MRRALDDLASAKDTLQGKKKKSHKGRNALLLAGVIAGALYNPWTGAQTREKLLDIIAGSDDLQPLETFETAASEQRDDRGRGRRGCRHRRGRRQRRQGEGLLEGQLGPCAGAGLATGERPLQRAGTSPLAPEMSSRPAAPHPRAPRRPGRPPSPPRRGRTAAGGERHVLRAAPRDQERVRRDGAVVAERQELDGMDLEVEVRRAALGVARVADEAEHVAGLHALAGDRERRVGARGARSRTRCRRRRGATGASRRCRSSRRRTASRRRRRAAASRAARRGPRRGATCRPRRRGRRRTCRRTPPVPKTGNT